MTAIFRLWFPRYMLANVYAVILTSPLLFGGLDMPFGMPGFTRAIAIGFAFSALIMMLVDIGGTTFYLRHRKLSQFNSALLEEFPLFTIYRSMTVHWLGFCIPLSIFWQQAYHRLGLPIIGVDQIYFIVVSLLTSYIHAILEYYFVVTQLEPKCLGFRPPDFERKVKRISLADKISRITLFVGVIPLTLLSFTLYLKLAHARQLNIPIDLLIRQISIWSFAYVMLAVAISLLLVRMLARDIAIGSWRLTEGFERLAAGDTTHRLEVATADEFESLADSFNKLVTELESKDTIYREFGRHVDPSIRDELLSGRLRPEGELRQAVILFCDIADFTILSEQIKPTELISYMNDLLNRLVINITNHKGTINKFLGDAILAFWNVSLDGESVERNAIHCAIEMQEEVARFNADHQQWREAYTPPIPPLRLGIGVHSGSMIAGTIGSEQRREYSIFGSNVNLAARLQQQTRQVRCNILISETIFDDVQQQMVSAQEVIFIPMGHVAMKGFADPQKIFGVVKRPPELHD